MTYNKTPTLLFAGGEKNRKNKKLQGKVSEMENKNFNFRILASVSSFVQIHKKW
jgi:hypothetical protein